MTTAALRRRAGKRISSAVWGLLVIGAGVLSMVAYSGYEVDIQLAAIILLAGLGGWMLLSAAVSGLGRKREIARATAPVVEEPATPPGADAAPTDVPEASLQAAPSAGSATADDEADEAPGAAAREDAAHEHAADDDEEPSDGQDGSAR